jgi:uncharacterized tellurite resistance protein B-like protein
MLGRNRAIEQLMELSRAVIADGQVSPSEVGTFQRLLADHPDLHGVWPADELVRVLRRVMADGVLDEGDRSELLSVLTDVAGEDDSEGFDPEDVDVDSLLL